MATEFLYYVCIYYICYVLYSLLLFYCCFYIFRRVNSTCIVEAQNKLQILKLENKLHRPTGHRIPEATPDAPPCPRSDARRPTRYQEQPLTPHRIPEATPDAPPGPRSDPRRLTESQERRPTPHRVPGATPDAPPSPRSDARRPTESKGRRPSSALR